ncbi:MAG: hypothetical protein IT574_06165 [Candidatus Aureabacteria bacterium]|jgi:hypothetical protein|nr:hypothetical protein [Candidatus Auribacterota bacterium]HQN18652.1 hypothetical protein [Syntrophobacteraceae bacterium]
MKNLAKPEKILFVMYQLCQGRPRPLPYEEIVVAAFKRFPAEFHLRGYPEYPDSSDIHKPLYAMKKKGMVRSANKAFQLTERGIEIAAGLSPAGGAQEKRRFTKQEEREINRVMRSAAFKLFVGERTDAILDTDFYEYIGATVRTGKSEFIGRLMSVDQAIQAHKCNVGNELSEVLARMHRFMVERFDSEITARRAK